MINFMVIFVEAEACSVVNMPTNKVQILVGITETQPGAVSCGVRIDLLDII
jgi:hypothetical protein